MIVQDSQTGALHQVPDHLSGYGDYGEVVYDGLGNPVGRLSGIFDTIRNAVGSVAKAIPGVAPALSSLIPGAGAIGLLSNLLPGGGGRPRGSARIPANTPSTTAGGAWLPHGSWWSVPAAVANRLGAATIALYWPGSKTPLHALCRLARSAGSRPGICTEPSAATGAGCSAAGLAAHGRPPSSPPPSLKMGGARQ